MKPFKFEDRIVSVTCDKAYTVHGETVVPEKFTIKLGMGSTLELRGNYDKVQQVIELMRSRTSIEVSVIAKGVSGETDLTIDEEKD